MQAVAGRKWKRTWPGVDCHLVHVIDAKVFAERLQLRVRLEQRLADLIEVIVDDCNLHPFHLSVVMIVNNGLYCRCKLSDMATVHFGSGGLFQRGCTTDKYFCTVCEAAHSFSCNAWETCAHCLVGDNRSLLQVELHLDWVRLGWLGHGNRSHAGRIFAIALESQLLRFERLLQVRNWMSTTLCGSSLPKHVRPL